MPGPRKDSYEDDFDDYEEDFESEDEPPAPRAPHLQQQRQPQALQQGRQGNIAAAAAPAVAPTPAPPAARKPLQAATPAAVTQPQPASQGQGLFRFELPPAAPNDADRVAAAKQLARARARMLQLKLSEATLPSIWHAAPVARYDLFRRGEGPFARVRSIATETKVAGEDSREAEAQAEAPAVSEAGCQASEGTADGGADAAVQAQAAGGASGQRCTSGDKAGGGRRSAAQGAEGQRRLGRFVDWATAEVLAEMARGPDAAAATIGSSREMVPGKEQADEPPKWTSPGSPAPLSTSCRELSLAPQLSGRRAVAVCVHPTDSSSQVCVAYSPVLPQARDQGAGLRGLDAAEAACGLLAVWRSGLPKATATQGNGTLPEVLLTCEGVPAACCYGAAGPCASVIVAATTDGALCAWDLSEAPVVKASSGKMQQQQQRKSLQEVRAPSYSGEAWALREDAVDMADTPVAVAAAPTTGPAPGHAAAAARCSIVVLGESGRVVVWALRLLGLAEAAAADADLGVRPGSRVLLVRTQECLPPGAALPRAPRLSGPAPTPPPPCCAATCLALVPGEGQQLLVGTASGAVLRGARAGAAPPPRLYHPRTARLPLSLLPQNRCAGGLRGTAAACGSLAALGAAVTSVAVSPFQPNAFLAALADGSLALHLLNTSSAVRVWPAASAAPLVAVRWSTLRPCVAFVADTGGRVACFDFSRGTKGPVAEACLLSGAGSGGGQSAVTRCCALEVSPGPQQGAGEWCSRGEGAACGCSFVAAFSDGSVQWHALPAWLSKPRPGDMKALQALLGG